jgi:hypothetical protein
VRLIRAEWDRLFHRRVTFVMTAVVVALFAAIAAGFAVSSRDPTPVERSRAEQMAAEARLVWQASRDECLDVARHVRTAPLGRQYPPNCDYGPEPGIEAFLPYSFSFRQTIEPLLYTAAAMLVLFGFVVGASFVGAEWTSGGMTNLLLWRPRRAAVLGAKLAVALAGVAAIAVPYLLLWVLTFWAVGATRGVASVLTTGEAASLTLTGVRALVLALFGTVLGFTLASIGRHTAMALGAGMSYLIAYELGITIIFALVGSWYPGRFRLSTYIVAWLAKRYEFAEPSFSCTAEGCFELQRYTLTWVHAAVAMALVGGALVAGAFLAMRQRDVA